MRRWLLSGLIVLTVGLQAAEALDLTSVTGTLEIPAQTLAAGDTITIGSADRKTIRTKGVSGSGGPVTLTSDPQITAGAASQVLELYGTSATDTVTLVAGAGLQLCGSDETLVLSTEKGAQFQYDTTAALWEQRGCRLTSSGSSTLESGRAGGRRMAGAVSLSTGSIIDGIARWENASTGPMQQCVDSAGAAVACDKVIQLQANETFEIIGPEPTQTKIFSAQEAGGIRIFDHTAACNTGNAGMKRYRVGAATVADMEMTCTKLPDNAYYWVGPPEERHTTTNTTEACEATPADDFFAGPASDAIEARVQTQSRAGYYTRLRSRTQVIIPTGQTMTVTLRKNGVDAALTCSQSNAQTCSGDQVVPFADGDLWNMRESCTTGGAATKATVILLFYPS